MKLKKDSVMIRNKLGLGWKIWWKFCTWTLKKPIEDLEIQFNKLKNDKKFIKER